MCVFQPIRRRRLYLRYGERLIGPITISSCIGRSQDDVRWHPLLKWSTLIVFNLNSPIALSAYFTACIIMFYFLCATLSIGHKTSDCRSTTIISTGDTQPKTPKHHHDNHGLYSVQRSPSSTILWFVVDPKHAADSVHNEVVA